jgi:hypothetical protein
VGFHTGPVWLSWPWWKNVATSVVITRYGFVSELVRWQNVTV